MPVPHGFHRLAAIVLAGLSAAALAEPAFVPVYKGNFPDPFVLRSGAELIAYGPTTGSTCRCWRRATWSIGRRSATRPIPASGWMACQGSLRG